MAQTLKVEKIQTGHLYTTNVFTKDKIVCYHNYNIPGTNIRKFIRPGDVLNGILKPPNENGISHFKKEPIAIAGSDPLTIKRWIKVVLKGKSNLIIYRGLNEKAKEYTLDVSDYLDKLSDCYVRKVESEVEEPDFLTKSQIKVMCHSWFNDVLVRRLNLLGISQQEIKAETCSLIKIYRKVLRNPYSVVSVSLEKCKVLFKVLRKKPSDVQKVCANVARKVRQLLSDPTYWNYTPVEMIKNGLKKLINIDDFEGVYLKHLREEYDINVNNGGLYLDYPLTVEKKVAKYINKCKKLNPILDINENKVTFSRDDLNTEQIKAIHTALSKPVSIITGGAGTGKTTIVKEIIQNLDYHDIPYMMTSFTGKAVARLKEVTQQQNISTMDRNIRAKPEYFKYLIIDEMSMISSELFYRFILKYPGACRLLFVGDINQLPPLSWGSLFGQLFKSGKILTCELKKNHRSDVIGNNGIVVNSERMVKYQKREIDDFEFTKHTNFAIIPGDQNTVMSFVRHFKQKIGAKVFETGDLKVITPYNKSAAYLNTNIRKLFVGNKTFSIKSNIGKWWYQGSVVMMTKNHHALGVMNGDEGIIKYIDVMNRKMDVEFFNGQMVLFDVDIRRESVSDVMLGSNKKVDTGSLIDSYAITIHKSQGSEWESVILYIPKVDLIKAPKLKQFFNFNLIYTAITRARKTVLVVGDEKSLNLFAGVRIKDRKDNLHKRLK